MVRVPTRARGRRPPSRFRPELWLQRDKTLLDRSLSGGLEGCRHSRHGSHGKHDGFAPKTCEHSLLAERR
jgi:hypothetical protein